MKHYFISFVLFLIIGTSNLYAQKKTPLLADLINKKWFPVQPESKLSPNVLIFADETKIYVGDGCNTTYIDYKYSQKIGFKLDFSTSKTTEKYCPEENVSFDFSFLNNAKSFVLEGEKLTFFDKNNKEIEVLYSRLVIDNSIKAEKKKFPFLKEKKE